MLGGQSPISLTIRVKNKELFARYSSIDCLFDDSKLLLIAIQFILVDLHVPCSLFCDMLRLYRILSVHGKYG